LEEKWISIPQRFIVYQSTDSDVADPYTVVYPDGAVFLFYAQPPHRARFLCRYNNFSKDEEDELIDLVPETVMEAIINQEV
jgi:hypothetical protein